MHLANKSQNLLTVSAVLLAMVVIGFAFQNCARPVQGKTSSTNSSFYDSRSQVPSVIPQPTPFEAKAPIGEAQLYLNTSIQGYAFDPNHIGQAVTIQMYVTGTGTSTASSPGTFIGLCATGVARPDVNAAYSISGSNGFACPITDQYRNGSTRVFVYAIDLDDPLKGLTPLKTMSGENGILIPSKDGLPTGSIESTSGGKITGWALDVSDPAAEVTIHVYVNGPPGAGGTHINGGIGTLTNIERSDINSQFPGAYNRHGFSIEIPTQYRNSTNKFFVYASDIEDPVGKAQLISNPSAPSVYEKFVTLQP